MIKSEILVQINEIANNLANLEESIKDILDEVKKINRIIEELPSEVEEEITVIKYNISQLKNIPIGLNYILEDMLKLILILDNKVNFLEKIIGNSITKY